MGNIVTKEQVAELIACYFIQHDSNEEKVAALNYFRKILHALSPFEREPVDLVLWVKADAVVANDYNPNVMATGEKRLLERSLLEDGFTQPVVVSEDKGQYLVVDGFHRQLLGRRDSGGGSRLKGWLPVTCINADRKGLVERIATTIRHNRARGKHHVTSMSDIVRDLARLGWTDERISQELGMDKDEVLRLKQISGLTELFEEEDFSPAWTVR